jgi:hypothetical protein
MTFCAMLRCSFGLLFVLVLGFLCPRLSQRRQTKNTEQSASKPKARMINLHATALSVPLLSDPDQVRMLYHKLHNIEDYLETLPIARETLLKSLQKAEWHGKLVSSEENIYALQEYKPDALRRWIDDNDLKVMKDFEAYALRRSAGGSRELLSDRENATKWLRAEAPLRSVDGAWLGNLSRVDSSWAHIDITRRLWQILSEELGDGDVQKHHTYLYTRLLRSLAPDLPDAYSTEFLDRKHGATQDSVWRSAVLQLMISLFNQDFLPEMLGFNLHFERLTLGMLKAMTELQELDIDPTYFMLHVCIDNAHSGHTAVALDAVCMYLKRIRDQHGRSAEQEAWRRIQAGYALSEGAWDRELSRDERLNKLEQAVADIFESKAKAGSGAHHMCKSKIRGQSIVDWLDLDSVGNAPWWHQLTEALGTSRTWIVPGDSGRSRFISEISWGGRMFGAFTGAECRTIREWVDRMPVLTMHSSSAFPRFGERPGAPLPFVDISNALGMSNQCRARILAIAPEPVPRNFAYEINTGALECHKSLPGIWFSHFCLLEKFVALPSRNGNELGSLVLRILRAQYGFENISSDGDAHKTGSIVDINDHGDHIFDLGFQMLEFHDLSYETSLPELLTLHTCGDLPDVMSSVSAAPIKCEGLLLGMAAACIGLHRAIAASSILDSSSKLKLQRVADIEQIELESAMLMLDEDSRREFASGFGFVRAQLCALFTETSSR